MKLDRNINAGPRNGKYAILKLRVLRDAPNVQSPQGMAEIDHAIAVLERARILDWGDTPDSEFMLIRLKDQYAEPGLRAYAAAAWHDDQHEYAEEIRQMADRAGRHPNRKRPD